MNCKDFEGLIPDFEDKRLDYATTKFHLVLNKFLLH